MGANSLLGLIQLHFGQTGVFLQFSAIIFRDWWVNPVFPQPVYICDDSAGYERKAQLEPVVLVLSFTERNPRC